jgi:hypothetical protein
VIDDELEDIMRTGINQRYIKRLCMRVEIICI